MRIDAFLRRGWPLILSVIAVLLMMPELILGPLPSDSRVYNEVWLPGFARELDAGALYPRWLPRAWDGFGSPTFYFYPPAFFYLFAAVDFVVGRSQLSQSLTLLIVLFASGSGMCLWLWRKTSLRIAVLASCIYMAAPYHLWDIHIRGALSESLIYAVLPFLMIALEATFASRRWAIPALAATFASLLLSHLPVALLTSVTLIPIFVIFLASHRGGFDVAFLSRALLGLALGAALAAIYLVPALTLIDAISINALWSPFFSPSQWFFGDYATWLARGRFRFVPILTIGMAITALSYLRWRADFLKVSPVVPWMVSAVMCFILISGVFPPVWRIHLLSMVQFPWRALVVMEFAVITLVAIGDRPRGPSFKLGLVVVAVAACFALVYMGRLVQKSWRLPQVAVQSRVVDAPEYLPAGYPINVDQKRFTKPEEVILPPSSVAVTKDGHVVAARRMPHGQWRVSVRSPAEAIVVLPQFYFPRWTVVDEDGDVSVPFACTRYRVVCWRTSGAHEWTLIATRTSAETVGLAISATASAVVLLLLAAGARRRWRAGSRP